MVPIPNPSSETKGSIAGRCSGEGQSPPARTSLGLSEPFVALGWLLLGGMLTAGLLHVSHDVAMLSEVGDRLAAGQMPYVDYVETEPPLVHYLHALIALATPGKGASTAQAVLWVAWLGVALGASSLALGLPSGPGDRGPVRAAAALTGLATAVAAVGSFAQREHLFALLYLPYLVLRMRSTAGERDSRWGIAAGCAAAIGLCIKPHFLVIGAAVEVALYLEFRHRRPTTRVFDATFAALVTTGLLYAAHFAFLPAEMRHAFFQVWLPAIWEGYSVYGTPEVEFRKLAPLWGLAGIASLAATAGRGRIFGVAGLAAVAVYFLQWKGWFYQLIPALTFGGVGLAYASDRFVERFPLVARPLAAATGLLLCATLLRGNALPDQNAARSAFARWMSSGDRVVIWSTDLTPAYPWLVLQGVQAVGTYPMAFPLAVLYPDGATVFGAPRSEAERVFRSDLHRDLDGAPTWLLIDESDPCAHCETGVSFPRYLEAIGLRTRVEEAYERRDRVERLAIWRRREPPPSIPPAP